MSKSRNRQLAKQHARRQAERRAQQRRKSTAIAVAALIAVLGIGFAVWTFWLSGDEEPAASASPTASPSATGPTGPTGTTGGPGERTGTVEPTAGPEEVACRADAPEGAMDPKPQFAAPAKVIQKSKTYVATMQTSCGDIVIELLDDQAPKTVNSFVFLAQEGFFDGQRIHRIDESIDVLQGGDPTGTGGGGPGYTIPDELTGKESYAAGTFAMANAGPDTGGSQFFIITGVDGHALDDQAAWTIFGEVIESLDVAEQIQGIPISNPEAAAAGDLTGQQPSQAVYIEKVTIATK